jgi:hypothetical protein
VKREDTLQGRASIRGAHRAKGLLVLTRRTDPPTNAPLSCDSSYFTTQVMGRAAADLRQLSRPGGAAQSANFRVTAGDRARRRRASRGTSTSRTRRNRAS